MRQALQGRTFLARGGNGELTVPQIRLAAVLGWIPEFTILTKPVQGRFPSLPKCYKVDVAQPVLRIAVEVDGASHRTRKWKFLDRRKTEILSALGWSVLRFTNERVNTDLSAVVMEIRSFMTSRSPAPTTISPTG